MNFFLNRSTPSYEKLDATGGKIVYDLFGFLPEIG